MGYQRSTFPNSVYDCTDTDSHKIIWTVFALTNVILRELRDGILITSLPARLRIDKGYETGDIATMHTILMVTWKILRKVLYLEYLQQIRSKNGRVSYMISFWKKRRRRTYESTGTRSLWPKKRSTLKYYSIYLHFCFRKRNAFICHKLEQPSYQIPERFYFTRWCTRAHSFPEKYGRKRVIYLYLRSN